MVGFKGDAIVLSGVTGTKLKSDIIGSYYQLWWDIASGGERKIHRISTSIVEMDAATGEIYTEDTDEISLGSSGHALQMKGTNPQTKRLNIILVEKNNECFTRLQNVIKKRWSKIQYSFYPPKNNSDWVYLLKNSNNVINILNNYKIRNALFFFDPLLFTPWVEIEEIAKSRIIEYYQIGTEFIIFLFTSDWFTGRGEWIGLPTTINYNSWTDGENESVNRGNKMFGDKNWQSILLTSESRERKMELLIEEYTKRLHKWFRHVLPMPFKPREGQQYHIFICSNHQRGVRINRTLYTNFTGNKPYTPDNKKTYDKFVKEHPEKWVKPPTRSMEWQILWDIIKNHEGGICDSYSNSLREKVYEPNKLENHLQWLLSNNYLKKIPHFSNIWKDPPILYEINWKCVKEKLGVNPPTKLIPLSKEFKISDSEEEKLSNNGGLDQWF